MRARSLDRFSRLVRYIAVDLHFDCLAVLSPLTTAVLMREMSTGKDIAYAVIRLSGGRRRCRMERKGI